MKINFNKKINRGFTLVELMVSISIFSVVMVMCMGSILSVLDSNRKSQSIRAVMDNLNYTLDEMTRTIRFGSSYHCGNYGSLTQPQNCTSGDTFLLVYDPVLGYPISYQYDAVNHKIVKGVWGGANNGNYDLTSPDVTITALNFYVFGTDPNDQLQPKVIVIVKGYAGKNSTQSNFSLQTTLSQRKFDF